MDFTAISPANILIPKVDDMTAWACVACDQFTSELSYWKTLEKEVSGKKTTLDLVLPEVYLDGSEEERIIKINENIKKYLSSGVFEELEKGFVLTVRSTPYAKRRIGIVGALDLEEYDYKKGTKALVRATEGTIEERIPPRLKIRKDAAVEFPHVMVLYDDESRSIGEKLFECRNKFRKLYDFALNMGGGSIEGYFIPESEGLTGDFEKLIDEKTQIRKYGTDERFLFAVGDGNHSLATAKTHWENLKKTLSSDELKNHPARYALCEFVNVYDEGIRFEPIFRYIDGVNAKKFVSEFCEKVKDGYKVFDGMVKCMDGGNVAESIKIVDRFIAEYINANGGKIDYVHGEKNLIDIVKANPNGVGVLLDSMKKEDLFKLVANGGALPRKTFSMGEGIEKRYYLEGRKIK